MWSRAKSGKYIGEFSEAKSVKWVKECGVEYTESVDWTRESRVENKECKVKKKKRVCKKSGSDTIAACRILCVFLLTVLFMDFQIVKETIPFRKF